MKPPAVLCLFLAVFCPLSVRCLEQQNALEPPLLRHSADVVFQSAQKHDGSLHAEKTTLLELAVLPKHHTEKVIHLLDEPPALSLAEQQPATEQQGGSTGVTASAATGNTGTGAAANSGSTASGAPTTTSTTTSSSSFYPTAAWQSFLPQEQKKSANDFRPVKDKQPWDVILGDLFLKLLAAHIRKRSAGPGKDLSRVDWQPCPELGSLPRMFAIKPKQSAVCDGSTNRAGLWVNPMDGNKVLRDFSPTSMKLTLKDHGMQLPASSMDISLVMAGQGAKGEDVLAGHIMEKIEMRGIFLPQISHVTFTDCRGQPKFLVEEHVMHTQYGGQRSFVTYKITDPEGNLLGRTEMLQMTDGFFNVYDQHGNTIANVTRSASWDISKQPKFCGDDARWTVVMVDRGETDHSTLNSPENHWVIASLVTVKTIWDQQRDALGQTHTWMLTSLITYAALFILLPLLAAVLCFTLGKLFQKPLYAWLCWVEERLLPKTPFKNSRYIEPIAG